MTSNLNSLKRPPRALPALSSPTSRSINSVPQSPPKIPHLNTLKSNNHKPPAPAPNTNNNNENENESVLPPPELAPLNSPSPSPDRFRGIKLPLGWLQCPLQFSQPLRDHRILVCKTPIDVEIAQYLQIPKEKHFLPHTIYTLPNKHYICKQQQQQLSATKKRVVGLVVDLTNQMYYDQISFNNGKKTNKVKRRIITMDDTTKPTESETSGFVGLIKSYLDATNNKDKWIVIHDELGYDLCGFMCCAFMVKELNYSVDAAVYEFSKNRKPGIYNVQLIRLLHGMFSDAEDLDVFEQMLKIKPLSKPTWLQSGRDSQKCIKRKVKAAAAATPKQSEFAVPTTSISVRRKRSFSEMSLSSNGGNKASAYKPEAAHNSATNIIMEPKLLQKAPSDIIMEPTLLEPALKKARTDIVVHIPRELKQQHSYLIAVGAQQQHLQHLTTIALQLSKNKDLFHSIQSAPVTIPSSSLMALATKYRITWLTRGYIFWLMILGKKGCFFVDPSYLSTGKLGGIYHIPGTIFYDGANNKYMDGTLCSGELVVDNINSNKKVPRFLIGDMLVFEKQSLSKFPHTQRLLRAENYLYKPFAKSLQKSKLRIRVKPMYPIENKGIINKLQTMIENELPHQCNGLGLYAIKPPFGQRILRIAL